jgi:hypothetical protein
MAKISPIHDFGFGFYSSIIASTQRNPNAGKGFALIRHLFMQLRGLR